MEVTFREAELRWGFKSATLREAVRDGRLRSRKSGAVHLVTVKELRRYIEERRRKGAGRLPERSEGQVS